MEKTTERLSPEEIKAIRERLEMTQDELAELMDVSVGTIHRWEKGKAQPRPKRMKQLRLLNEKVAEYGGEMVKHGLKAWLTFAPRMMGSLAGASVGMLLENSFARWVEILQQSATRMITHRDRNSSDEE